jgi:CRP-like cAMP-binding protein
MNICAPQHSLAPLVHRLACIFDLSEAEKEAALALPADVRKIKAGQDLVREGDRPSRSCLILDGFVCRYAITGDGKRQILAFHTRGDIPDLQSLHLKVMDHSLAALEPSTVAFLAHEDLRRLITQHPRIGDAFWRDTLIDAAVFREWMIGIGRRSAHGRIAHLLCELFVRLMTVGMAEGTSFRWPITQAEVGDALGLSNVHVNRVLQDMRADGLISLAGGLLTIHDWPRLKELGEFNATYLHIRHAMPI